MNFFANSPVCVTCRRTTPCLKLVYTLCNGYKHSDFVTTDYDGMILGENDGLVHGYAVCSQCWLEEQKGFKVVPVDTDGTFKVIEHNHKIYYFCVQDHEHQDP